MRRLLAVAPYFFCVMLGLSAAIILPNVVETWGRLTALLDATPPPIVIHGQRLEWVGPRTLQSRSDGVSWTRSCPIVFTSRGALTADGGYVGLTARVISGPLKGATFDPRYRIEGMVPQERGGSVIQYDLPAWLPDADLDDLQTYNMVQRVPVDRPCADGYAGQYATNVTIPRNSEWRAAHGLGGKRD